MRQRILAITFLLSLAAMLQAQDYRGRVQGVVTDPSNASVARASVTLVNTNTGNATARVTDEFGKYLFDYVEPGTYTLKAESPGFGAFIQEGIQVLVRSDLTVNVSLKLGDVTQTITVAENAVEIQFNTTTLSQT